MQNSRVHGPVLSLLDLAFCFRVCQLFGFERRKIICGNLAKNQVDFQIRISSVLQNQNSFSDVRKIVLRAIAVKLPLDLNAHVKYLALRKDEVCPALEYDDIFRLLRG